MNSIGKLLACLEVLEVNPSLESFADRKRNQKLAYLVQEVAGISLGYSFSWYIRGPYAPSLTRDLYANTGSKTSLSTSHGLKEEERSKMDQLRNFLGDYVNSSDLLELLVSLHFLRKLGRQYGAPQEEIIRVLKEKKPFFSDQDVSKCWLKLEELENY